MADEEICDPASVAEGAWDMPTDAVAFVHRDAMVVAALRAALGNRDDRGRMLLGGDADPRPEGDARAASRATATRARLLGLIGPGRSGGSIG